MTNEELLPLIERVELLIQRWRERPTDWARRDLIEAMRRLKEALEQ
jgi:hypothetical protein